MNISRAQQILSSHKVVTKIIAGRLFALDVAVQDGRVVRTWIEVHPDYNWVMTFLGY